MMKKRIFTGAGTAVITPFTSDGNAIDYAAFRHILDHQIQNKIDAIVVCGTTGEASTLSDDEHRQSIGFAVEYVAGRVPVIAGTGSNDTVYCVELSKFAQREGADGLLLVTPYYNKCTQNGLIKHFMHIADSVSLPTVIYNVPPRTGFNIQPLTYAALAAHENIVATKEANSDIVSVARTRALCGDNLDIYSGNDDYIVPILSLGGIGVISVMANLIPRQTHDICQLFFEGKIKESADMQIRYMAFIDALFCEVNPVPVKYAMSQVGMCSPALRMPLFELEEKNRVIMDRLLRENGLI